MLNSTSIGLMATFQQAPNSRKNEGLKTLATTWIFDDIRHRHPPWTKAQQDPYVCQVTIHIWKWCVCFYVYIYNYIYIKIYINAIYTKYIHIRVYQYHSLNFMPLERRTYMDCLLTRNCRTGPSQKVPGSSGIPTYKASTRWWATYNGVVTMSCNILNVYI